jgi:TonB family protein
VPQGGTVRHSLIRTFLLLPLLLVAVTVPGAAQVPTSVLDRARAVVNLTGSDELVLALRSQLLAAVIAGAIEIRRTAGETEPSSDDRARLQASFEDAYNELIPPAAVREVAANVYAKHFTASELDAMADFLRSPVGQKMIRSQGVLAQEVMAAAQKLWSHHQPEILRRVQSRLVPVLTVPPAKIKDVPAIYPQVARAAGIQGTVVLDAVIGPDGRVTSVGVVSGPTILRQAATDAVRQWVYAPPTVDGKPAAVTMQVTVSFELR